MNISPVQSAGLTGVSSAAASERDTFLELLVTQLTYQDPLSPIENEEFAAQLAQFSALEQLQQINTHLTQSSNADQNANQSIDQVLAATLIGNQVEATGSNLITNNGEPIDLHFRTGGQADEITVRITDANGRTIREMTPESRGAGDHQVTWDGRDQNNQLVPEGPYAYSIIASRGEAPVAVTPVVRGAVKDVSFDSGQIRLNVGGHLVALSDITRIMDTEE